MTQTTYYVVQPFEMTRAGRLIASTAMAAQTGPQAVRMAERQAAGKAGAVAFSRTGDPETGDFDDAVMLGMFGQVPEDLTAS
ncbi:MAG: hypothetical protein G4V63_33035 [Candidatus Afipia apatlaquensis]|uniref:Uncharacterized protein n=1 Tax=Candidatus Afipia apatlaquensis TaxID=2712852 RepID=A0A7C9VTQ0_9BRAD|nr:hypothetical protein [Candidatus Afipia apatlaquensis]